MPRVKDWQKPGQANKSEIATFFPNFPTFLQLLGRCLGISPRKGLSFVENATLCNWKVKEQEKPKNKHVGARWVSPTLFLVCNWFLDQNVGAKVGEKKGSTTAYRIIQTLDFSFQCIKYKKIYQHVPKQKLAREKCPQLHLLFERRVFGANCSLSFRNCTCKQKFTFKLSMLLEGR